jgi:hypothetical protein
MPQLTLADKDKNTPDAIHKDGHPKQTSIFEMKKTNCSSRSDNFAELTFAERFAIVAEEHRAKGRI